MSEFQNDRWELPNTWQWVGIGEIADVIGGGTPSTINAGNFGGDIPWITPADMSAHVGKTIANGARLISAKGLEGSGARWLPKGSVLFSSRAPIGYVAIASQPVTTNQGFKSFVPAKGCDSDYLYYWLTSAKPLAEKLASGTTFLEISGAKAALIPFPVAPAAEQTRIVAKLEELLSDLDAGVAELKAAQKKLGQYRQSLLKAAVEGALTADWRAAQHAGPAGKTNKVAPAESGAALLARILTERRSRWETRQLAKFQAQGKPPPKDWQSKYPAPVAPETTGLPALPAGWVWATVDQLAHVGTGVTPLRSKIAYFDGGTIPWVTSGALNSETVNSANEQVTTFAVEQCRLELYPAGSLLLAMYGEGKTRGKCAELLIAATINQAIAAIVLGPSAQGCKAYLKAFLLKSYEKMREQASGGVQPNLNLQIVKSIYFPLPPLDEQTEINRTLCVRFEQLNQQRVALEISLKQSAAQRKNILQAAFSGQLVPQDPADEPASALLARIRAERAARETGAARGRGKKKGAA
ncbi:MAG: restriction endonuclease subunit S [Rhodoferax sp.]|uniref:restriction endonuclease subunit S n=1 Tax=Rhodoferax sp. TaxID=50421 RepID=UPI002610BE22|nr:restriction endonuclease subunit S [Rhodoferax sp.]MDD2879454.1 restriction endonuclease subunit S [Rhodoferax sp.]